MNERIFTAAAAHFPLREKDIGAFASIRGRGMTFAVKAYEAPGAGSLCLMEMSGMAGLSQRVVQRHGKADHQSEIQKVHQRVVPCKSIRTH